MEYYRYDDPVIGSPLIGVFPQYATFTTMHGDGGLALWRVLSKQWRPLASKHESTTASEFRKNAKTIL